MEEAGFAKAVTVGGVGGSRTGPGGGTAAAGRVGVKVTGPGGNTYTKVAGGAAIRGPGGNTVAAGRGASFVNGQFVDGGVSTANNPALQLLKVALLDGFGFGWASGQDELLFDQTDGWTIREIAFTQWQARSFRGRCARSLGGSSRSTASSKT